MNIAYNENNIYFNNILIKNINVKSKYLNEDIEKYIETYLKNKVEGLCIDEGYIKPDSVKIIKRSVGMLLGSRFTGDITYEVVYTADVCNPVIGNILDCKVKFINKLGILGYNGPISIIVGKQLHNNEDFKNINRDDIIKVEVIAKKFSLNDKEIKIVGKLWNENNTKSNNKKNIKKEEFISSDLTPVLYEDENEMEYNDNTDNLEDIISNNSEEEDNLTIDDEYNEEDELLNTDDELDVKIENPDNVNVENELDVDDIDVDSDNYEEDDSIIDYE